MMGGAPKRWLDDGGSGLSSERDVLRAGVELEPRPGDKDAVWAAIMAGLPPPGGGGAGGGGGKAAAAKGASGAAKAASFAASGVVKGLMIVASGAALIAGVYVAVASQRGPATKASPIANAAEGDERPALDLSPLPALTVDAVVAPRDEPAAREPATAGNEPARNASSAEARATAVPAPSAPATVASDPAERKTQIMEASHALTDAHEALRAGDASGALAKLEAMRGRFPPGMLAEEREMLAIEALAKSGQSGQAKARAEAFLRAYPNTIHAPRLEPFTR
jgi:hypothetical protein